MLTLIKERRKYFVFSGQNPLRKITRSKDFPFKLWRTERGKKNPKNKKDGFRKGVVKTGSPETGWPLCLWPLHRLPIGSPWTKPRPTHDQFSKLSLSFLNFEVRITVETYLPRAVLRVYEGLRK